MQGVDRCGIWTAGQDTEYGNLLCIVWSARAWCLDNAYCFRCLRIISQITRNYLHSLLLFDEHYVEGLCVICTGLIFLSQYSWCYATLAAMSLMDRISDCCTAGLTAGYMVSCNFDLGCHGTWPVLPGSAPGQHHLELQSSDLKIKTFEQVLFCLKYSRNE